MNASDLVLLTNLIESLISRVRAANALRQQLSDEGRTSLTAAELASLQSDDDAARATLASAIAEAKAAGR